MDEPRRGNFGILKAEHARQTLQPRSPGEAAVARAGNAVERFQSQAPQQAALAAHLVRQPETRTLAAEQIAGYMVDRGGWTTADAARLHSDQTKLLADGQGNKALQNRQAWTERIRQNEWREEAKGMTNDQVAQRWAALGPAHEQDAARWQRNQAELAQGDPAKAEAERVKQGAMVLDNEFVAARRRHEQAHTIGKNRDD